MASNNNKHRVDRGEQYPLIGNFIHYHIMQQPQTKTEIAKALNILPKGY
jgi:hypothetical protein